VLGGRAERLARGGLVTVRPPPGAPRTGVMWGLASERARPVECRQGRWAAKDDAGGPGKRLVRGRRPGGLVVRRSPGAGRRGPAPADPAGPALRRRTRELVVSRSAGLAEGLAGRLVQLRSLRSVPVEPGWVAPGKRTQARRRVRVSVEPGAASAGVRSAARVGASAVPRGVADALGARVGPGWVGPASPQIPAEAARRRRVEPGPARRRGSMPIGGRRQRPGSRPRPRPCEPRDAR
jgi:hypothetical protein